MRSDSWINTTRYCTVLAAKLSSVPMSTIEPDKVLYIRAVPYHLANKLKAAAALQGKSLQAYLIALLHTHVSTLERNGKLPKGKS